MTLITQKPFCSQQTLAPMQQFSEKCPFFYLISDNIDIGRHSYAKNFTTQIGIFDFETGIPFLSSSKTPAGFFAFQHLTIILICFALW